MEINSARNNILYPTRNERIPEQTHPLHSTAEKEDAKSQDNHPLPQDEYISSESVAKKPSGLYQVARDDNGNRQIIYDDPNKKKVQTSQADSPSSSGKAEECTTNTDKVDREIEKLKEEKKKLEQQLRSPSEDEASKKQLEQKLSMIENELQQKDNDTYRRQNSTVQEG